MRVIDIPVLPIDTPLDEAFAAMRKMKRSGVAARGRDGQYWLFEAGSVVVGRSRGERILADIKKRSRIHRFQPNTLTGLNIDFQKPQQSYRSIGRILGRTDMSYALWGPHQEASRVTRIMSLSANLAARIGSGPTICYCTNPHRQHPYEQWDVPDDGKCTRDGYQIVCAKGGCAACS
jgi:hypothetical protein